MKLVLAVLTALLGAMLLIHTAQAQQRIYNQAELDAMLAPIALQPDGVVSQILIASTYPEDVAAAARWSRANPHLQGDDAVRAVQHEPWDPAVKALVAFPDLLLRMDESPQWLHDLGEAFVLQEPHVMDTVQALRRRAHAAGYLPSTEHYAVYEQEHAIVVQPRTQIVYVHHYDPYVVYGPWWWPHYRPMFWRPWAPRPVFVAHGFFYAKPDWHHRHVRVVHRPVHVHQYVAPGRWQPRTHVISKPVTRPYVRVPESQRRPIVQQHAPLVQQHTPLVQQHAPLLQKHMPAANAFSQPRRDSVRPREWNREHQARPRGNGNGRGALRKERG